MPTVCFIANKESVFAVNTHVLSTVVCVLVQTIPHKNYLIQVMSSTIIIVLSLPPKMTAATLD